MTSILFEDYNKIFEDFITSDCEIEILKHSQLEYFYIICTTDKENRPCYYYKKKRKNKPKILKPIHFTKHYEKNIPFVVLVILHLPVFHQYTILYRPSRNTLEFIDPQPPIPELLKFPDSDIFLRHYDYIDLYFQLLSCTLSINMVSIKNQYQNYHRIYPPQYLENEVIENNELTELKNWQGGSCIFWSTMMAIQIYSNDITFEIWFNWFINEFKDDPTNIKLIDWLRKQLFHYIVICKRNKMKRVSSSPQ